MLKKFDKVTFKELFLVVVALFLLVNLIKSWAKLSDRLTLIKETKLKVTEEQEKKKDLERELAKTESSAFIEKQAREKLNMGKEGELTILLPTPVISTAPTPVQVDESSNWEKWVKLFL